MRITQLRIEEDGTRNFAVRTHAISYRALLRCIRGISGASIAKARHHAITGDTEIIVRYEDVTITIEAVFADYIISCTSSSAAFDEFISKLSSYRVKPWEYFI